MNDNIEYVQRMQRLLDNPAIKSAQQIQNQLQNTFGAMQSIYDASERARVIIESTYPNGMKEYLKSVSCALNQFAMINEIKDIVGYTVSLEYIQKIVDSTPKVDVGLLSQISNIANLSNGWSVVNIRLQDKKKVFDNDFDEDIQKQIIEEIYLEDKSGDITNDAPSIFLAPVNDRVLKYLAEDPNRLYELSGNDFEDVMLEIYRRLGYNVEKTKSTRDGGKDIIIRRPEILGDFVYYVECKKYAENRKIGVGIVRNLHSTITTDNVNCGIIATTSYFTRDAKDYILNNNLGLRIKTHDFGQIKEWLAKVV